MPDKQEKNVEQKDNNDVTQDDFSTFFVTLPSKGKLYSKDSPMRDGKIEMRYGSAVEEDILTNQSYINKKVVFDKLLNSLIVNENVDIKDLIVGDMNTLIVSARRAMYGPELKVKDVRCPRCNHPNKVDVNIDEFDMYTVDDNVDENEFVYKSQFDNTFKYHILTVRENRDLRETQKKKSKLKGNGGNVNVKLTDKLVQIIDEINGDSSKMHIKNYVKDGKMKSIESKELRKDILNHTPDIDMTADMECSNCVYEGYVEIPLSVDFF